MCVALWQVKRSGVGVGGSFTVISVTLHKASLLPALHTLSAAHPDPNPSRVPSVHLTHDYTPCGPYRPGMATARTGTATARTGTATARTGARAPYPTSDYVIHVVIGHHLPTAQPTAQPTNQLPNRLPQVQTASPQLIVLGTMSGWGVSGNLVTLLPDQPLPLPPPSPSSVPPSSSQEGLSSGAVAGIVVGSVAGAALLVGAVALLLLRRFVWC